MPKTTESGEAKKEELPDTIRRSPEKAQRTFAKAHDSAAEEYGEGERAYRVAFNAVKHNFEKKGDHWEPKDQEGPSEPQAATPRSRENAGSRGNKGKSSGGVDSSGGTKEELLKRARELDVRGRSAMSKQELAEAITRQQKPGKQKSAKQAPRKQTSRKQK